MICIKTCMLSSIIIFWLLSGMLVNKKTPEYTNLLKSLNEEQKTAFDKIVQERTNIFKKSSMFSVVISLVLLIQYRNTKPQNKLLCLFIVSYVFVMSCIYMAWPKSDYMVRHLKTQEQRDNWINMKKNMGSKKYYGIGVGIFVYSLFNSLYVK